MLMFAWGKAEDSRGGLRLERGKCGGQTDSATATSSTYMQTFRASAELLT